jgi:succinate-semialdehyde dehydrogenase / glutarate-semialdehyde dehydrogenase
MPLTDAERRLVDSVPHGLLVDGTWREASGGRTFGVEDPSTGETICDVADATPGDALAALAAAAGAQARWAATAPRERAEILRRAHEAVLARAADIALVMTLEQGKPLSGSLGEIAYGAEFFRWFGEQTVAVGGEYRVAPDGRTRILTMRQPVGPCLFITPWNFPLAMGTRKIAPAIAAGCTMVVKPAAETPLTMLLLADILAGCGLPPGVLNVITTSDPGAATNPLLADARLRKLSFTGSTAVGRQLYARAADQVLRVSLELGGNAPFIVYHDADLEAAVDGAMIAKMRNTGQACTAANRFLVDNRVSDEFAARLVEKMAEQVVGRGTDDGVTVGPLVNAKALAKVGALVDDAVAKGGRILLGGKALPGPGYFYAPTVIADVPDGAHLLSEEVFGPVAPIRTFAYDAEAVAEANATEYGLVAFAYTADLQRAMRTAESLEAGMVGINVGLVSNPAAPFGGVKSSGVGRESGFEGIDEFLETKYVALPA